jgi:hypothetical protein
MKKRTLAGAFAPFLASAVLLLAFDTMAFARVHAPIPESIHCPAPEAITFTQIPSSIHGYYSAVSEDGTGWGALSLGFYDPEYLSFSSAEVSEINGYWRIYCSYEDGGTYLNLSSGVELAYKDCHFPDGKQTCEGTRDACEILCPAVAPLPEPKPDPEPQPKPNPKPDPSTDTTQESKTD